MLWEKGGCVAYDDVDAAHLLGDHDGEGGEGRSSDTWDGEELDHALDVGCVADDVFLHLDLGVDVVQVSCSYQFVVSESLLRTGMPRRTVAS